VDSYIFKGYICEKGASLVEFALVMPILLTIIFTTIELGIMLAIKVNLQSCVMAGAYYGATGAYTTGSSRTASAQAVMTNSIAGFLTASNLTLTIQSYPTFAIASLGGVGTAGTGNPYQVGMYQASYVYSPITPVVAGFFGTARTLTATTYTKNQGTFPS
jgi:Flp pilus assembly protein TadG